MGADKKQQKSCIFHHTPFPYLTSTVRLSMACDLIISKGLPRISNEIRILSVTFFGNPFYRWGGISSTYPSKSVSWSVRHAFRFSHMFASTGQMGLVWGVKTKGRMGTPKRMNFRKSSKGEGGGRFQSKHLCCKIWTFK